MKAADPELLAGQVAWVTASARGLGRAIAERLARCGAAVAVHSRSDRTAAEFGEAPSTRHVAEEIASFGAAVTTVFADISDPDQARTAAETIVIGSGRDLYSISGTAAEMIVIGSGRALCYHHTRFG